LSENDDLKTQLRRWGFMTVNRYARTWDGLSGGDSILAQAKDLAPGTRENAARRLAGRDGGERRRFMAEKASTQRCEGCGGDVGPKDDACPACGMVPMGARLSLRTIPMWAVDPVRATNNASRPHENHAVIDLGIPDDLRWVDQALVSMARTHLLRSIIVRTEFTVAASQAVKARIACDEYEREMAKRLGIAIPPKTDDAAEPMTVRQYRYELSLALEWMRGKLAA